MAEFSSPEVAEQASRRPGRVGTTVGVRLLPDLLDPLDRFRAAQGGISRPEAIRLLMRDGLAQADAMPTDPAQQSSLEPEFPQSDMQSGNFPGI